MEANLRTRGDIFVQWDGINGGNRPISGVRVPYKRFFKVLIALFLGSLYLGYSLFLVPIYYFKTKHFFNLRKNKSKNDKKIIKN